MFGVVGMILVGTFLPNTDLNSYRFLQAELLFADGYVVGIEETNCLDGDTPINAIYYQYRVAGQSLVGSSYSSSLSVKALDKVQVEYVAEHASYSRIKDTINAPFPLWVLLLLSSSVLLGLSLVNKGIARTKQLIAIVADAFVATGTQLSMRSYENDDSTVYEWHYRYEYNSHLYTHIFESNAREGFSAEEKVLVQRGAPSNAVLARNLPRFVRDKLGIVSV